VRIRVMDLRVHPERVLVEEHVDLPRCVVMPIELPDTQDISLRSLKGETERQLQQHK